MKYGGCNFSLRLLELCLQLLPLVFPQTYRPFFFLVAGAASPLDLFSGTSSPPPASAATALVPPSLCPGSRHLPPQFAPRSCQVLIRRFK